MGHTDQEYGGALTPTRPSQNIRSILDLLVVVLKLNQIGNLMNVGETNDGKEKGDGNARDGFQF